MKTLVVEDDFTSRLFLQTILSPYGECHIAVNGLEAIEAFCRARDEGEPYDLICLDIMMPEMDGQTALQEIRRLEEETGILSSFGAKIIMTTALGDPQNVMASFRALCDGYQVKPIDEAKLLAQLQSLGLIP